MFANLLIILASSLVVIALFRRLSLPPVLGYLSVGLMVGPTALDWVNDSEDLPDLAELGVVFLLFSLGLEFSLSKMLALRRVVFGLGSLQVLCSGLILGGLLALFGMPLTSALMLGTGLALSSTAIVSKELTSLGEIFSSHGQNAIGVLLFQDVVAVLLLTLVPVFAGNSDQAWYWALPVTLGKTLVLFFGLLLASRWLLPRLFHEVAASHSAELFVLLALVIVLLTAWLTHLLGLSPALGAFLAGMLLGESHYRHQIEADIRPFRDILLGLFFVSIGMLIDLQLFIDHSLLILGLTLALLLIKGSVVAILLKLRGSDGETAWRSGLALAQGGEFCFALMAQMQLTQMIPSHLSGLLLAATFSSMLLTPLLLRAAPVITARLHRKPNQTAQLEEISAQNAELQDHVVICGYGRVGQSIGRFLRHEQLRFIALDDDPVRVQEASAAESCVHYGDCRRGDLLAAVGLERARLLVIAVDKTDIALTVLKAARRLDRNVPILVRTRDDSQLAELKAAGANEVVPELLESSLMLASHALIMLGLPEQRVQRTVDEVRHSRYRLLHGFYHGAQSSTQDNHEPPAVQMHAVNLDADAHACNRLLQELGLEALGVDVQGVQRNGSELPLNPAPRLRAGDRILVSGSQAAIEACEARLQGG
ncbi:MULTISPECIES: monovalent cation:proton antiporter family protein [Pseudomonas]|uniref:monovalent cation:proton antiporter family protein n=1 Tax=Pseudomonas TaxID=286 RepID=UPI0020980CC5|nr:MULTISPECIES: monovalent cation:proton antiporter family protein [Pseudomonas]MCO7579338.1 monovalent cation:proton antiporter-2 (CPA2) family protein [Pseudomonas protegens]MCO7584963.1 monovalent cation:proton antiporter-2 (CPA2) family protein [Pseudomonas chlororaphis]MCO7602473.1 monovalent cation:proton antiporter-2 (CPA2) family protein [Pseudomonas chlororaphis]MDC7814153.1 monovalent cation:proton antiporter-2 (CPA2) family protein [Pseudomonas sp. BLCC-B112]